VLLIGDTNTRTKGGQDGGTGPLRASNLSVRTGYVASGHSRRIHQAGQKLRSALKRVNCRL